MRIRCPRCSTRYQIDAAVLERAGGKARCYRCSLVFDAAGNAVDGSADTAALADAPRPPEDTQPADETRTDAAALDELDIAAPAADADAAAPAERELPFEVPDDLPELLPQADVGGTPHGGGQGGRRSLFWLLALLAIGQILWHQRATLLALPALQPLAAHLCPGPACASPTSNAAYYGVIAREIAPSPDFAGRLDVQLSVVNRGPDPQPLPGIRLELYDTAGGVVASRRFRPRDYDATPIASDEHVPSGEQVPVRLRIEDPGDAVTGFELAFFDAGE